MLPAAITIVQLAAAPQFAEQVAQWQHAECEREGITSTLDLRRRRLVRHLDARAFVPRTWVGESRGHALGCVSLVSYHHQGKDHKWRPGEPLWISGLYVDTLWRRRGLGMGLLATASRYAADLGADSLWLMTRDQRGFYERHGWQWVRDTVLSGRSIAIMQASVSVLGGDGKP